jgi:hypothetical protein
MDTVTLFTILATALVTTAGTAVVTWQSHRLAASKDAGVHAAEQRRHASYLAIRTVCILDRFISDCSDVVADDGDYIDGELTPTVAHPTLEFPDDVDWKSIPPPLMYRILALPNSVDAAGRSIDYMTHIAMAPDFEEHFAEVRYQFSKLGIAGLDLVCEMRDEYGIPDLESVSGWDPRRTFEIHTVERDRMQRQGAAASAKILAGYETKREKHDG